MNYIQHNTMIASEHKDTTQVNCEAPPIRFLQNTGYPQHLHYNGAAIKNFQPVGDNEESPEKPFQHHASGSNNMRMGRVNGFEAQFYPYYSVDSRFHYPPFNTIPHHQRYPSGFQFQDFQYFVVIDFEATCDKGKKPHPQEIIEFPSVIVNSMTGHLESSYFQTYVRPTCNRILSDFCKDLTGIQQTQVDRGVTLSEALLMHDEWLEKKGIKNSNFAVVTWGNWDCRVMLESECRYKKIPKPSYFNRWINLKVAFHEAFGAGVRSNDLKEAVQHAGLGWQGRAHCGLDDAKNTARLLALFMRSGIKLSITDYLN
ncbi:PREDICTED: ERI1 exoribonuclease 2-like [Ipomoea nil]|uniref:ERI1 exoribonuclease 2-like n=1 Tax=Ipomoea nil TaxID=35883 RepID=UPI0009009871|nr:PREDICTED: ERI1 exoribonuclease 2-like [Ipomoea nil]